LAFFAFLGFVLDSGVSVGAGSGTVVSSSLRKSAARFRAGFGAGTEDFCAFDFGAGTAAGAVVASVLTVVALDFLLFFDGGSTAAELAATIDCQHVKWVIE